jgi:dipeptidyl aminopeptidase/acylaminoacyl peptidase
MSGAAAGGGAKGRERSMDTLEVLIRRLAGAWSCWSPTLTAHGRELAYVCDRGGLPELWVQGTTSASPPRRFSFCDDPVLAVHWSPDGRWLACSVATGGGVRTEVWVVRPDGSEARRVAGVPEHAMLGPWSRRGHRLAVTLCNSAPAGDNRSVLVDPDTGAHHPLASGSLRQVLDVSEDERFALVRDGSRGAESCLLVELASGRAESLLPYPTTGATAAGVLRPDPMARGEEGAMVAYLVTDAGLARRGLVGVPLGADGRRGEAGALARRRGGELELIDADSEGRLVLLVWNVGGYSEVEVLDVTRNERRRFDDLPGTVVAGGVLSRDGSRAVLSVESPSRPRQLWQLGTTSGSWTPLTEPSIDEPGLIDPTLRAFVSHDGLEISGWLYRRPPGPRPRAPSSGGRGGRDDGDERGAAVVYLHGGPEAQERPGFEPHHQVLAAAGMTVFAPNIRGSSGYGRTFVHADDRYGRLDAIDDVERCAEYLVEEGLADPDRVAVAGRSYGGYAALMALTRHPESFAAGVDVCGMSDLLTFYRDTEPWIAMAAVTKYGDPRKDAGMLASLSPLHHVVDLEAPLLVVHGELDTNVPLNESRQLVSALRSLDRPVEYLELPGEGHEYRRASSRIRLLEVETAFLDRVLVTSPVRAASSAHGRAARRSLPSGPSR